MSKGFTALLFKHVRERGMSIFTSRLVTTGCEHAYVWRHWNRLSTQRTVYALMAEVMVQGIEVAFMLDGVGFKV